MVVCVREEQAEIRRRRRWQRREGRDTQILSGRFIEPAARVRGGNKLGDGAGGRTGGAATVAVVTARQSALAEMYSCHEII